MKLAFAAALAIAAPNVSIAAPAPPPPAGASVDDGHCVVAFYMIVALRDSQQANFSEDSEKMARDGFLYYSGRLNARADEAGLRLAVANALKDTHADIAAVAASCLQRMGGPLGKTEDAIKAAAR